MPPYTEKCLREVWLHLSTVTRGQCGSHRPAACSRVLGRGSSLFLVEGLLMPRRSAENIKSVKTFWESARLDSDPCFVHRPRVC